MKRLIITTLLVILATQCVPIVYADGPVCWDTPTPQPTLTPDPTATLAPTLVPTETPMPTATELPTNTPWPTLPILTPEPQKERLTNTPPPTDPPITPVLGTPIKFVTPIPEVTPTKTGKYSTPVPTATIVWIALPNTGNDEPITMGDIVWWLSVLVGLMFAGFVVFASVVVATRSK